MATHLINLKGVKYDGIGQLHEPPVNLLSMWLRRAKIPHMGGVGGFKRTCKGLFTELVNQLPGSSTPPALPIPRPYGSEREPSPVL